MKVKSTLNQIEAFGRIITKLRQKNATILCTGVINSQKIHLASEICKELDKKPCIITYSEPKAKEIEVDLAFFGTSPSIMLPNYDYMAKYADFSLNFSNQAAVLAQILEHKPAVTLSIEALAYQISSKKTFESHILDLKVGDEVNLDHLVKKLINSNYYRSDTAELAGSIALRGGILDIFALNLASPVRIEFFGDEIDSIRLVDLESQRSVQKIDSVKIIPADSIINEEYSEMTSILDYLDEDYIIFIDEPNRIYDTCSAYFEEHSRFLTGILEDGRQIFKNSVSNYEAAISELSQKNTVLFSMLSAKPSGFAVSEIAHFDVKSNNIFQNQIDLLKEDLDYFSSQNYTINLFCGSQTRAKRLQEELENTYKNINFLENSIKNGFEYPAIKTVYINYNDKEIKQKRAKNKRKKGNPIESFVELNIGDYIVHESNGIGIFKGIEKIEVDYAFRDYLKLEYHGGAFLYVSANQLDSLQRYIGNDSAKPKISRLGNDAWQKTKSKAKREIDEIAKELVELYAKREHYKGYEYSKDTTWQAEFEETFAFEETDDQIFAIEDVKADMESSKIMDRLICGDVGYGKTEIALRAAFKAAIDQKQVAYLCPTTILAHQHYNAFVQRMKDFPLNIRSISRFSTASDRKKTLAMLKNGSCDIVVGTHALLAKEVEFKDLGLVIVDEEQRFGVKHKERLKTLRENVDVLTLSATPIPRTLHISLANIRSMSILETPPLARQPIQTYVMEHNLDIVKTAIMREVSRGGQAYYLHNRVENIAREAHKLQELLPDCSVAYAHGQMNDAELTDIMVDFINGQIDVLVATTIIENGLDIPNVNTIIIKDADNLGLAQLYQLRGRVGRSNRSAFAYLMYQKGKILSEVAEKRLQTIKEFNALGSGFKIAMRDLEIRGAGNILGQSQSGHMMAIGYEMFTKLLAKSINEMQGIKTIDKSDTLIDININAFIPSNYIENEHIKLSIYKKISHIQNKDDYFDIQEEIEDRFGNLPKSTQNLLEIALLKANANDIGITSIVQKGRRIVFAFKPDAEVDPVKIHSLVQKNKRLSFAINPSPLLSLKLHDDEDFLPILSKLVEKLC